MYLQINNINKFYGNTHALSNVSFDVRKGTIHAICGENGAGKSTLIKILCGLIPHGQYEGSFTIDGVEKILYHK
ncbi:MAG: ATP-binding cassette domain-containing protein [Bacteroidetes bacterium]|nr:ATP-binding cassette domain-containing protein [Bacteroidota bacterium]